MSDSIYARDEFIADWAKLLKCDPHPYHIAVQLINVKRNYHTAMAVIFGLSWNKNQEYLNRVVTYFSANWSADDVATVEWLGAFVDHYVTEVEKYPE
jgi:hypothetical protein